MARKNAIIEADQDDEFNDVNELAEGLDDEFEGSDGFSDDELTTEEVEESTRSFSEKQRHQLEKSRKGRAAPAGPTRTRATPAQKAAQARAPVRARQEEWKPSDTLDAPPPRVGMEQRWVRFRIGTDDDQKNFSSKQRGGWVVRALTTVPAGYFPPTMRHSQMGEVIAVGDLILCERPRSIGVAQKKYFRDKLRRQTQAGQRHIRKAERSDHPIDVEEKRDRPTVGYGQKRRVSVQSDE
jgi:hypothetical protein